MKTLAQLQSIDTDKLNLDCIGDKVNFFQQRVGAIIIHTTEISNPEHSLQHIFKWLGFTTVVSDYAAKSSFPLPIGL